MQVIEEEKHYSPTDLSPVHKNLSPMDPPSSNSIVGEESQIDRLQRIDDARIKEMIDLKREYLDKQKRDLKLQKITEDKINALIEQQIKKQKDFCLSHLIKLRIENMAQISDSLEEQKDLLKKLEREEEQFINQDEKADAESIQL